RRSSPDLTRSGGTRAACGTPDSSCAARSVDAIVERRARAHEARSPGRGDPRMDTSSDPALLAKLGEACQRIKSELGKVVVGQDDVKEQLLVALFARGHCIVTGVPGLAKTLLISTLAKTLGLSFNRIQFTPDMMPSDITGTEVLQQNVTTGQRELTFIRGPIFSNIILADEINRTPPKTQSALLESMQEFQVT